MLSSEPKADHTHLYVSVKYRQTHHKQQWLHLIELEEKSATFKVQYLDRDDTQQWVIFSTDRQTTHSNVYSSVPKDRPHSAINTVQ